MFTCLRAHIGEQAVDELHSSVLIEPAGLHQPVVLVRRKTVDLPDVERGFGGHGLMLESQQGLLEGSRLVLDATRVEASAALKSLRAELTLVDDDGEAASQPEPEPERARPLLALAEPRSGSTLNRTASNQTAVSLTDPDAKLRHKPGQRPHLVHRAQVATDPRARCIVAVWAEPCDRERGRGARAVVDRARWSRHRVAELCATRAMPQTPPTRRSSASGSRPSSGRRGTCATPPTARPPGSTARTQPGVGAAIDRMTHGEGAISELKLRHGLGRARCRGTRRLQVQLLLAATAINLKRLLSRPPAAETGVAGNNRTAIRRHLQIIVSCLTRLDRITRQVL